MLPSSKIVKKTALTALKDKWLKTCIASIPLIFSCVFNYILFGLLASFSNIAVAFFVTLLMFLFVIAPLILGEILYFRRLVWGMDDDAADVFYYFSDLSLYKNAVKFILHLFWRAVLPAIVFFFPAAVTTLLTQNAFYLMFNSSMPVWAPNLSVVAFILEVTGVVALFFTLLKYYLAPFLFVSIDGITPQKAISLSITATKNHSGDYCLFFVSFAGWLILSVLVFPLLFTLPYFLTSFCVFCRYTVAHYNKNITPAANSPQFEAHF